MNTIKHMFIPIILLFIVCLSCDEEIISPIETDGQSLSILPLGDSRVEGARPAYESYRYELWKLLVEKGWEFDLVGTRKDPADYPRFQSKTFDTDHMGTGGATTEDILQQIQEQITDQNAPEVVLLGIGGNDLTGGRSASETLVTIGQIIDFLQEKNPSITILLEQIAPGTTAFMETQLQGTFDSFNQGIPDIASRQTEGNSQVLAVNMASDWEDQYMADEVHYNEAGARVVAERYMGVLEGVLGE